MKKFELVFIPAPGMGHLPSIVEMANILVTRDQRLYVTLLIHKLPFGDTNLDEHIQSLSASFYGKSIRFIVLPKLPVPQDSKKNFLMNMLHITESYKPCVREAVTKLFDPQTNSSSSKLVGFVVDMFCTTMIDVAKEFEVPCYVFYTGNAGSLAINFELQELYDKNNSNEMVEQMQNSDDELVVPGFVNPVPKKVLSRVFFDSETAVWFYDNARRFRSEIKGIMINTFFEMESHILNSMSSGSLLQVPPLYSVGPILYLKNIGASEPNGTLDHADLLKWLDNQPPSSVVFLCFGSLGSFDKDQVEEIARALEQSGTRFVWSLRQPPSKGGFEALRDYVDITNILPKGFLDRTTSIGKVIGWAPQVEILAHPSTGGFISHCGWNSTLESVWHSVPMATWPMYAEQQLNAFEMVVELGLAVEITIDYQKDNPRIVSGKEIESGIRKLMEDNDKIKKKVQAKSEESKKSVIEGGSSFTSLGHFIDDILANSQGVGD